MNVAVLGGGAMGHVLAQMIEEKDGFALAGMVDPLKGESLADLDDVDVVIDFSNPANLPMVMAYCEENKCPAVIATTGFSDEETAKIQALGQEVPVVFSANYSLGINVMKRVVAEITPILEDTFDIEIIEKHHTKKLDSPSGTAILLADKVNEACKVKKEYIYGRHSKHDEFRMDQIGIHAVRGGTIPGEHTVIFAGPDEVIELNHLALSRDIFANGAIAAAQFIVKQEKGQYSMDDLI